MPEVQKEEEPFEKLLQELEQEVLEEQDLLEQDLQEGVKELKGMRLKEGKISIEQARKSLESSLNSHEATLKNLKEELEKFNNAIKVIDEGLKATIIKADKTRNLSELKEDEKAELVGYRSNLLSAMSQATSIKNPFKKIKNTIRKIPNVVKPLKQTLAKLANKSLGIISQIAKKCIRLLSQFNNQMQIDSITVTFGISTTVAVTLSSKQVAVGSGGSFQNVP
jgi:chromosome segregation ATPase